MNTRVKGLVLSILLGLFSGNSLFGFCGLFGSRPRRRRQRPRTVRIIEMKNDTIEIAKKLVWAVKKEDDSKIEELQPQYDELRNNLREEGCNNFLDLTLPNIENEEIAKVGFPKRITSWVVEKTCSITAEKVLYISLSALMAIILKKKL